MMKKYIPKIAIISLLCLFFTTPVMAMEPIDVGFDLSNIGDKPVTVLITDVSTKETETVSIDPNKTVHQSYSFTEPEIKELSVACTDKSQGNQQYTVRLYASVLDDGTLQGYTVSQITGTKVKPAELTFGSKPKTPPTVPPDTAKPDTGNDSPLTEWKAIAILAAVLAICTTLIAITIQGTKKRNHGTKSDQHTDDGTTE